MSFKGTSILTQLINLLGDEKPVFLDDRSALLGGSFYNNPTLMPYSPLPLRWAFDQLIRYPKAVLLDVGASTGCFTLLSRHHPDLEVHSFEPVPLTYLVLEANVYLNGLNDKVHLNQMGVSDYNGKGIMNVVLADGGKGVSILDGLPAYHKATEPVEVDVTTIDAYCKKHKVVPTLLKCDCEGLDKRVLDGAANTIERYHPFILTEYSAENADQYGINVNDIIIMLENWGYVWTNPEGMDIWAVHRDWEKLTNIQNNSTEEIEE